MAAPPAAPEYSPMKKILVVEDSPIDQKLVVSLLEKHSAAGRGEPLSVACANDGKEGLVAVEKERPDLVITDLQMPRMNGLQLVESIRAAHPSLPVVLMTAFGSEDIAVQALDRGAASYVPKRRLAADLVETVESILEMLNARREQRRVIDQYWLHSESHFQLPNDLANIAPLIGHLQDNLTRMRACDEHEQIRLAVALREALSNAIVHGNLEISSHMRDADDKGYYHLIEQRRKEEPYRSRFVTVIAEESPSEAVYVVRDDGPGFDASNLPDPTEPENLEKVSGRGLLLIQTFMDDVQFNSVGNEITMIKRRER
jgi:CheY-like chemotaxis protein/anti-sigma regulatory factor (Ser/Thr protein kinase)